MHADADKTCAIDPADDASLAERPSYVAYYWAKVIPRGSQDIRGSVSGELLKRVCDGINTSREVEPWFRDKYNRLCQPPKKTGRVLRKDE
jgi:hypothetical protein